MAEDYSAQGGGTYSGTAFSSGKSSTSPEKKVLKFGYDVATGIQYDASGNVVSTPGQVTKSVDRTVQPGIAPTDAPGEAQAKLRAIGGVGVRPGQIEQRIGYEDYLKGMSPAERTQAQRKEMLIRSPTAQFAGQPRDNVVGQISANQFVPERYRQPMYKPSGQAITLSESQYAKYQSSMRGQVGRGALTEYEASKRALVSSGYKSPLPTSQFFKASRQQIDFEPTFEQRARLGSYGARPGSLAAQAQELRDAGTIQKAGGIRTMGAVLSSTSLFSKAAETEIRGIAGMAGFKSGYDKSVGELMQQTAERLRNKPSLGGLALESPITAAIPIGAGFKVGGYLARAGIMKAGGVVGKAVPRAGGIISGSQKLVEPAFTIGGVAYVGSDVVQSKDLYQAGGKLAGYAAMAPGAMFGYKNVPTKTGIKSFMKSEEATAHFGSSRGRFVPRVGIEAKGASKMDIDITHATQRQLNIRRVYTEPQQQRIIRRAPMQVLESPTKQASISSIRTVDFTKMKLPEQIPMSELLKVPAQPRSMLAIIPIQLSKQLSKQKGRSVLKYGVGVATKQRTIQTDVMHPIGKSIYTQERSPISKQVYGVRSIQSQTALHKQMFQQVSKQVPSQITKQMPTQITQTMEKLKTPSRLKFPSGANMFKRASLYKPKLRKYTTTLGGKTFKDIISGTKTTHRKKAKK